MAAVISQIVVFGQQPFNTDLYVPIPLQPFTPPKDTAYKENKLVVFNMLEKRFETVHIGNYSNNLHNNYSPSSNEQPNEFIKSGENQDYGFTDLAPADQLAEFPNYPMSAIVKLFLTFFNPTNNQNSFGTCSGVVVAPGFIITGGHCVKSKFDSSYVVECTVVPAYNLGSQPFGFTTTTNWYTFTQWTENGNLDYDIAIMSLSSPIGNTTGWIDLAYNSDTSFYTSPSNAFYSFGYPGYDPLGNPVFEEGERMYYMNGYMDFWLSPNRVCHNNIGYSGQSGSGLFHQDTSNNRQVLGVLSGGNLFPPYYTCHCRMDSSMLNYFNSIISPVSKIETEHLTKQILVYPNPSNGIFNLDFGELPYNEIKLQVFDVLGQQITTASIEPFHSIATIDLTSFPNGTYFIKAAIDGKTACKRIYKTE